MSRTINLAKFVGTISLGLLTGVSFTSTFLTLRSIVPALPAASLASSGFKALARTTSRTHAVLSALSSSSLLLAYWLAPARGRHPYLLYGAAASVLPWAVESAVGWSRGSRSAALWSSSGDYVRAIAMGREDRRADRPGPVRMEDHTTTTQGQPQQPSDSDEEWGKVSGFDGKGSTSGKSQRIVTPTSSTSTEGDDREEEDDDDEVNGEVVKVRMNRWGRWMLERTLVWGVGWSLMVVGIWGDGV